MEDLKKRIKQPAYSAAIIAFIFGIAVHLYGLVNTMHNHDDINNQPSGFGTGVESGRWLLTMLGKYFQEATGNYDLTLLNGVIYIAFLAVSIGFVVATFKLKSRKLGALVGMVFVVFPTATCTLLFRYTAPYYGLSILMAVLAVWVIGRTKLAFLLSAVLTALSLGIYQAYLPLTASLFVLLLLKQTLEEDLNAFAMIKRGIYYCGTMVAGLVIYYIVLQLSLDYYGKELLDYQGISSMGKLPLSDLFGLINTAISAYGDLISKDYYTLAQTNWLRTSYLLIYVIFAAILVVCCVCKKRQLSTLISVMLLCLALLVAGNLIVIMCPNSDIRTLMIYSMVIVPWAPMLLIEILPPCPKPVRKAMNLTRKILTVVVLVVILSYSYLTQVNYSAQYFANRQVENYMNALVAQVRMTEGFDTQKEWAFLGYAHDPLFNNKWMYTQVYTDNTNSKFMLNSYSRPSWLKYYFGYTVPVASNDRIAELRAMEEVKNMPVWPNAGSIKIIDDTIVIKFQQ